MISGEKVVLREKRIEDAAADFAWRTDEELAKLDATRPLNMSYAEFLRYVKEEIALPNPRSKRLAIDTIDGKHIGNFMYYDIDLRRGEAELGIMIGDRDYWGKGYGIHQKYGDSHGKRGGGKRWGEHRNWKNWDHDDEEDDDDDEEE